MLKTLSLLLLLAAFTSAAFAQQSPPPMAFQEIDGAKNPELIPLSEAMRSMFAFLCDGPVPQPISSRGDYFKESRLTQDEQDLVTMASIKYHLTVNSSVRELKKVPRNPATFNADRLVIMKKLDREFEQISASLQADLGPEAYKRLVVFIETFVKRHMSLSVPVKP